MTAHCAPAGVMLDTPLQRVEDMPPAPALLGVLSDARLEHGEQIGVAAEDVDVVGLAETLDVSSISSALWNAFGSVVSYQ